MFRTGSLVQMARSSNSSSVQFRSQPLSSYLHCILMTLQATFLVLLVFHLFLRPCLALSDQEIQEYQTRLRNKPIGERISFWAERFIGVPYDIDPLGEYVSEATIVSDERVDCMYLTFRTVELALSHTPEQAIQVALERRFRSKGILKDGHVTNYDDRFEYGEDMIESGKWGKEITSEVGRVTKIRGARGREFVEVLSTDSLLQRMGRLRSGDLIFFAKKPGKRDVDEIIGHIGIVGTIEAERGQRGRKIFLIHASGTKGKGGAVKKVLLREYLSKMPFIGVKITRFQ